jgi:hypothetical protein
MKLQRRSSGKPEELILNASSGTVRTLSDEEGRHRMGDKGKKDKEKAKKQRMKKQKKAAKKKLEKQPKKVS